MRLNKKQLIVATFLSLFLIMVTFNLIFIFNANQTVGIAVDVDCTSPVKGPKMCRSQIEFNNGIENTKFYGVFNVKYHIGEKVNVIYSHELNDKCYVYSFLGFWFQDIIITFFFFILLSGIVHGLFNKDDVLEIRDWKFKIIKK